MVDGRHAARRRAFGEPRTRRGARRVRALVIVFAVFVGFMVIDAFVGDRGLAALVRSRQEHDRLAAEVAARSGRTIACARRSGA